MIFYLGKEVTEQKLVKDLKKRGCDPENNLSNEFLMAESYQLGEWEYIDDLEKRHRD